MALRRSPIQQRSRDRVEALLAAAKALIAEQGSDALRMGEVAERAGVPIGSLYQYFPDKSAVIRTLAERYNAAGRACIATELAAVTDAASLGAAFARLTQVYYGLFLAEPVLRDIWSAIQADKGLREFELAESRRNGALLAEAMARVEPGAEPERLADTALLVMQLGEAAMRMAISVPRAEGDRLVAAYTRMAVREIAGD